MSGRDESSELHLFSVLRRYLWPDISARPQGPFLKPDKKMCWEKVSSVALWAFIRPALPSSGEPTLDHAVLFMCFKSTIVVIFWKGQAAVEVILTLFPPFPPPSPVVNRWACVHPQHHPSHLYYWIWINSRPPTSTVDFFSPDIDSMHEPAQFTAKQIPLLNLTALLWWALHWFLDGGCLAPPHGREELFAGWSVGVLASS